MSMTSATAPGRTRRFARAVLLLLAVEAAACLIAYLYVNIEYRVYIWDFAMYHWQARMKQAVFVADPINALRHVKQSLAYDYNDLFTIPLLPFFLVFGEQRTTYIVGTTAIYLVPYVLVMTAIATRLIPARRAALVITPVVSLLTPAVLAPTLLGYPDMGAAALMALAVWVYLQDLRLSRTWQSLAIGALLTVAMLFRRHFIYNGIALVLSLTVGSMVAVVRVREEPGVRPLLRTLLGTALRIAGIGVVVVALLAVFAWPFLRNLLFVNYGTLYESYVQPIPAVAAYLVSVFGLSACVLAALGYLAGIASRFLDRPTALFLCIFGTVSFLIWVLKPRHIGIHYSAHLTLPIVLGLSALGCLIAVRLHGPPRALTAGAFAILLAWGAILGLTHFQQLRPPVPYLFPADHSQVVQQDMAVIRGLIDDLRGRSFPEGPIYVASSSGTFSADTLFQGERQFFRPEDWRLKLVQAPKVDSRDDYPLEPLYRARYVLVASPLQTTLSPEEHDVVRFPRELFLQGRLIAADFTRRPETYRLDHGVILDLYERTSNTTLETAIRSLAAMQQEIQPRPGGQKDWMILHPDFDSMAQEIPGSGWTLRWEPGTRPDPAHLVYLGDLPESFKVTGRLVIPAGVRARTWLSTVDAQGSIVQETEPTTGAGTIELSAAFARQSARYLVVEVESEGETHADHAGAFEVTRLVVEPAKDSP